MLPGVVFISQAKRGIRRTLCFGSRFLKYRCNFCGENSKRRVFSKSYIIIIISDEKWDDLQHSRVGQLNLSWLQQHMVLIVCHSQSHLVMFKSCSIPSILSMYDTSDKPVSLWCVVLAQVNKYCIDPKKS